MLSKHFTLFVGVQVVFYVCSLLFDRENVSFKSSISRLTSDW